jgi:asparagine synthase (glutamine-hydrolysing)
VCGIAGFIGSVRLAEGRLRDAARALRHRGPDASGIRRFTTPQGGFCDLVHARLSIIDLDPRADQPMSSVRPEGGDAAAPALWLTYNGELYDYLEVRADLEAEGERFATASDTEVLLRALDRWGRHALDRFEGMWAFGLYDEATGTLTLSRDRFGEKPLFVHRAPEGLYFASEPKALFALRGGALPPDHEQLARYLVNGYKSLHKGPSTFFRGLGEVPAGGLLTATSDGPARASRYWEPRLAPEPDMGYAEAVAAVRERLVRSVELRLRADVPLAFCLSGGVDSVSLISIAARALGHDTHGFTIVNTDSRYEEADMIAVAVEDLGVRHTEVRLSTDGFLAGLRRQVAEHDAPVVTITYYAHRLLMSAIADAGYRISISGTAADELFTGYYDHHVAYLAMVRDDPLVHGPALAAWDRHVRPVVRNPHLSDPELFVRDPGFRDHIVLKNDEFAARLVRPFAEAFAERAFPAADLLRTRMLNELFHESVPVILAEDDLNAMAVSVENRSPFLDRHLAELSWTIPTRHLVRDGRAKAVLRDAMRGIAPDAVLDNRRKVGFNAPLEDLLDTSDPAVRAELLSDSPLWDLVRREAVEDLLDRRDLPNSESKFLFSVLGTKMFLETYA